MSQPSRVRTLEPVRGLAKAAGACSEQDMQPGVCAKEFEAFKACVTKQMGRKW
ncbi:hypothetical protein MCUN1_001027 [Malassezia cuniculi]|uniref:Uncharacterized protein n=1 Tax=Malassezia cuniculi TaxID=948313 RepID=A0AAF0ES38_9BASI|nr:hypothetical protein MCUN1_001027 [Malassezia cuniculi]